MVLSGGGGLEPCGSLPKFLLHGCTAALLHCQEGRTFGTRWRCYSWNAGLPWLFFKERFWSGQSNKFAWSFCLPVAYWICFLWFFTWCARMNLLIHGLLLLQTGHPLQSWNLARRSCSAKSDGEVSCILRCVHPVLRDFRWFQRPTSFQSWSYLKIIIFRCCVLHWHVKIWSL